MKKQKTIDLDIQLPLSTIDVINGLVKQGILGETTNDVILHILRQHLFEQTLKIQKP